MKGKIRPKKAGDKRTQCLRVVEIRFVPTPDAESRLSRAIDILLRSAVKEPEESINAKKEEEPPRDNRLAETIEGNMNPEVVQRKPGRPRAIPETLMPKVLSLYHRGLGYRAVARELREEGISVDWSTVRRVVKGPRI